MIEGKNERAGQHTPGPWAADVGFCLELPQVGIPAGVKADGVSICTVRARPDAATAAANARLIAAAPDLLEALVVARVELLRGDFETGWCKCGELVSAHNIGSGHSPVDEGSYDINQAIEVVDAAISKARGAA